MSYLVLARKYRPQVFDDVVGQEHVTQTLSHSITANRVAHAILFSGPRGTGKTTVARILAKAMNCEKGPAPKPCNICQSCREITADSAADVFEIDGASNNSVDQIRELRDNIVFLPNTGRYKIYIIDEVHMLSTSAFNALLKTLEEPPPHVLFMFATTEIKKIPITILSRCQRHDLRRIDHGDISSHLETVCQQEQVEVHAESLALIARQADGSMRDALSLLDQVMAGSEGPVTPDFVLDVLGGVAGSILYELCDAVLSVDVRRMLTLLGNIYKNGQDIGRVYIDLLAYVRDLTVIKLSKATDKLIDRPQAEIDGMARQVESVSETQLALVFDFLYREEATVRLSSHPRMAMEMVFIKLTQTQPALPIDTLIEKLDQLKTSLATEPASNLAKQQTPDPVPTLPPKQQTPKPVQALPPEIDVPPVAPELEYEDVPRVSSHISSEKRSQPEQVWAQICRGLEEAAPALSASLTESKLIVTDRTHKDKNHLVLEVNGKPFNLEIVNRKRNRVRLEQLIKEAYGSETVLTIRAGTAVQKKKRAPREQNGELQQKALEHPIINDAIEIFNGKIEKVDIIKEDDQ